MRLKWLGFVTIFSITGCADDSTVPDPGDDDMMDMEPGPTLVPPKETGTTRAYLAMPRKLTLEESSVAQFTAYRDGRSETVNLAIKSGELTVHAQPDGNLVIDTLVLGIGDIQISAQSAPPAGLALRDIRAAARDEMPPTVRWETDDSSAVATGSVRLFLDWSILAVDGQVIPLAQQKIDPVLIAVQIERSLDGQLAATIVAERDGLFLNWPSYPQLGNLKMGLTAIE